MSSTDLDVFLNETSFYIFLVFRHLRHIYVFIIALHQQELLVCFIPILGFQLEDFLNLFLIDLLSHPIFDKICTVNLRFQLREVRAEADDPVIARLLDGGHDGLRITGGNENGLGAGGHEILDGRDLAGVVAIGAPGGGDQRRPLRGGGLFGAFLHLYEERVRRSLRDQPDHRFLVALGGTGDEPGEG